MREAIDRMYGAVKVPELDTERAFSQVLRRIAVNRRKGRIVFRRAMKYAAAILLPLGCVFGGYFLWKGAGSGQEEAVAYVRPRNAVTLTLASGEKVALDGKRSGDFLVTDAVAIRQDSLSGLSYEVRVAGGAEVRYNTLDIPVAAVYRLQMSDGTVVYLNSDSRLKYPEVFAGKERRVYLEGEAYFEVAKDAGRPFRVVAGGVEVNVLGTHFNVNAYPERKDVETTLAEGKVRVVDGGREVVLSPGEQAVASADALEVREVDVREYTSWKDGLFMFSRMPLEEVMMQVYRWYGIQAAFFNEEVRAETFTGVIDKNMPAEELFRVIEKVVDVRFTLGKDNQVVITAK